jgi:hypothetical protein
MVYVRAVIRMGRENVRLHLPLLVCLSNVPQILQSIDIFVWDSTTTVHVNADAIEKICCCREHA